MISAQVATRRERKNVQQGQSLQSKTFASEKVQDGDGQRTNFGEARLITDLPAIRL